MSKKISKKTDKSVHIWGLNLFGSSIPELLTWMQDSRQHSGKVTLVMTPNPEQVVLSRENKQFMNDLQEADVLVADGVGLVWAAKLLSWVGRLPQAPLTRISGADLAAALLAQAKQSGESVLIIGGREYQAGHWQPNLGVTPLSAPICWDSELDIWQLAAQPRVFWLPGYRQATHPQPQEENQVRQAISRLQPQVIFVALGAPQQERWAQAHKAWCQQHGVAVIMVVGGAFDYHLGMVTRAPRWWRQLGLEWSYRLAVQPWRWRRQLRLISFLKLVVLTLVGRVHTQ